MTTPAEKALAGLDMPSCTTTIRDLGEWALDNEVTIRRALKIAAAVDGDGLMKEEIHSGAIFDLGVKRGNNDLLERLRGIGRRE